MRKRMLSLALALMLALALLPFGATAAEVVDSGTCGENLTWTLDSNGKLTISGTGKMEDYAEDYRDQDYDSYAPWSNYNVKTVVIESGVSSIGRCAFISKGLTSITIPSTVTSIGQYAFEYCWDLESVKIGDLAAWCKIDFADNTLWKGAKLYVDGRLVKDLAIPDGVKSITASAFMNCSSITSVTIPNSVKSIGDHAFGGCTSLKSVKIGSGVSSFGSGAFSGCKSLTDVKIENGVTGIGGSAFSRCTSLTSVTIPDSVMTIGNVAFSDCTSLTSVTIPDSVKSIGVQVFSNCTALRSVKMPDRVKEVGGGMFRGCTSLEKVTLPSNLTTLEASEDAYGYIGFFAGCTSLTSFEIPESVSKIGVCAFSGCTSLMSVTIPDSVTSIGGWAFSGCTSLTEITIPDSVTSIGGSAFSGCTSLTSITIPDSVKDGGESVFYGCSSLENVNLSSKIKSLGNNATKDEYRDSYDDFGNGEYVYGYFEDCSNLKSIVIPDGVTTIDWDTFYNCNKLQTVTIPASVTTIEQNAFDGTRLQDVYFTGTQEQWDDILIRTGNDPLFRATLHLNSAGPEPITKNPFVDVKQGQYYYDPVLWAVNHGPQITNGTSADKFSPENTCTRGQVVTFLWRAAAEPEPTSTKNPFKDVSKDAYYYKAVLWAVEQGITNGKDAKHFAPNDPCTRAHVVTFLHRFEGTPKAGGKNPFTDVKKGQYYTDAVLWAVANGITTGKTEKTFAPSDHCTRAQIVTFLYRDMK